MRLEVRDLSFAYPKQKPVLDHISMTAKAGEVLGIIGPNGTGKTTFIKCLNHILTPTEGDVYLDGVSLGRMTGNQLARTMAYVPQFAGRFFPVTVIDTIMMGRTPYAGSEYSAEDEQIVFDVMREMNLEKFAFRNIGEMSGGERQRVFIARAMAQQPKVIILDEPTASLDIHNQLFTLKSISELARKQNVIIIMIIHDLNLASMFCDKLLMLQDGHIFAYGTPGQVITESNIYSMYHVHTAVTMEEKMPYIRLKKV